MFRGVEMLPQLLDRVSESGVFRGIINRRAQLRQQRRRLGLGCIDPTASALGLGAIEQ
jgi:hypothetical protein